MMFRRRSRQSNPNVTVLVTRERAAVLLARTLLDSAGVPYLVTNDGVADLFGWGIIGTGYSFIVGAPAISVSRADEDVARELLADLQAQQVQRRVPLFLRMMAAFALIITMLGFVVGMVEWFR